MTSIRQERSSLPLINFITQILCFIFVTSFVLIRFFARAKLKQNFGIEDGMSEPMGKHFFSCPISDVCSMCYPCMGKKQLIRTRNHYRLSHSATRSSSWDIALVLCSVCLVQRQLLSNERHSNTRTTDGLFGGADTSAKLSEEKTQLCLKVGKEIIQLKSKLLDMLTDILHLYYRLRTNGSSCQDQFTLYSS